MHIPPPDQLLRDPALNKGTAFTHEERDRFKLHGLLPCHISTLEEQVERRYETFRRHNTNISRHLFLSSLQSRNEVLFYRLVSEHIHEMLPYIYTPTVGDVSQQYSYLYSDPRGLYLSYPLKSRIEEIVQNISQQEVSVIVVTDGERILGLGDLGTGGMAIPIGKLSLYTIFGGIHPAKTLPVFIDVGTNNKELLDDPLYLGWRHPRISGKEYDAFIDVCVKALHRKFPGVLLQWEDFGRDHAGPLLERYRHEICSFNDDIQGTASVALAALLAAIKVNRSDLGQQSIVIFGGGSAGIGIAHHFAGAMTAAGVQNAKDSIFVIDVHGLVHDGLKEVPPHQRPFARPFHEIEMLVGYGKIKNPMHVTLEEVVSVVRPTVLIGVSAQPGVFTKEVVQMMPSILGRPIIFPLSNPQSKCEANPADIVQWTKGNAIIATGSPFEGFAQCNNVYIFPGVGLGVVACKAKKVTDSMFYKAAEILSKHSPLPMHPRAPLFPPFDVLRKISREIALGVVQVAQEEGLAVKTDQKAREKMVDDTMWTPAYSKLSHT
jgi:malate dehydrogenase (oxaloacetate-decarboxylating)